METFGNGADGLAMLVSSANDHAENKEKAIAEIRAMLEELQADVKRLEERENKRNRLCEDITEERTETLYYVPVGSDFELGGRDFTVLEHGGDANGHTFVIQRYSETEREFYATGDHLDEVDADEEDEIEVAQTVYSSSDVASFLQKIYIPGLIKRGCPKSAICDILLDSVDALGYRNSEPFTAKAGLLTVKQYSKYASVIPSSDYDWWLANPVDGSAKNNRIFIALPALLLRQRFHLRFARLHQWRLGPRRLLQLVRGSSGFDSFLLPLGLLRRRPVRGRGSVCGHAFQPLHLHDTGAARRTQAPLSGG